VAVKSVFAHAATRSQRSNQADPTDSHSTGKRKSYPNEPMWVTLRVCDSSNITSSAVNARGAEIRKESGPAKASDVAS